MLRAKFWATDLYGVCAQSVRNGIVSFSVKMLVSSGVMALADSLTFLFWTPVETERGLASVLECLHGNLGQVT